MNNMDNLTSIWPEWRITKHIGSGSYGQVYKAVRDEYATPVYSAIKVITIPDNTAEILELKTEGLDEKAIKEYYRQKIKSYINEIELMEAFKGTANVVNIEDYRVVEKTDSIGFNIYIRMELLTSFNDYIKENVLTQKEIVKLGIDICGALELFDRKNIIHRDIKPENLFVSDSGDFKIGDLGIARKLESGISVLSAKGTYSYMAPEIVYGKTYNIRADIYSLGIVLYKLCNKNRLPFVNTDSDDIDVNERKNINSRRLKGEKFPKPVNADEDMAAVVLHVCEYNPDERFQTPTEFKNALVAVGTGEKIIFDKRKYSKIKLKVIIGIIVFFFLSVLTGIFIWGKNKFLTQNGKTTENEENSQIVTQELTEKENNLSSENLVTDIEMSEQNTTTDIEPETTTDIEQNTTESETTMNGEQNTTESEATMNGEQNTTESETTTELETETETESEIPSQTEQPVTGPAETVASTEEQTEAEYEGFIVPKGCTYYTNERVYNEGMNVDVKASEGHRLETKDYVYSYGERDFEYGNVFCGWDVQVIDSNQTVYEELLGNIAGEKLLMMNYTYEGCVNMKEAPMIPAGVEIMVYTYSDCDSMEVAPVIPEGVNWMYYTFGNCDSLRIVPTIPGVEMMEHTFDECVNLETVSEITGSVKNWYCTFNDCIKLSNVPDIPQGAYSMEGTFGGCLSLKETPFIPEGVKILRSTFVDCESLIKVTNIPDSVTDMKGTFYLCNELQYVPELPQNITSLNKTFMNCKKLSQVPEIPKYVTNLTETFRNCDSLETAPVIPENVLNMENTFMGCMSLKTAPVIPSSVNNMTGTFSNCMSLTGKIVINANPVVYKECFTNVRFKYQNLILTGSSTILEELHSTADD